MRLHKLVNAFVFLCSPQVRSASESEATAHALSSIPLILCEGFSDLATVRVSEVNAFLPLLVLLERTLFSLEVLSYTRDVSCSKCKRLKLECDLQSEDLAQSTKLFSFTIPSTLTCASGTQLITLFCLTCARMSLKKCAHLQYTLPNQLLL